MGEMKTVAAGPVSGDRRAAGGARRAAGTPQGAGARGTLGLAPEIQGPATQVSPTLPFKTRAALSANASMFGSYLGSN